MNSTLKGVLIFASGAAVGSISTYFAVKKVFEAKADLEINEVRGCYEDKLASIEEHKSSAAGELEGPKEIDIKEKVKELNNKPSFTDYSSYFKAKGEKMDGVTEILRDAKEEAKEIGLSEDELAEMEGPEDDEPYSDEEDRDQTLEFEDHQLNGEHKKAIEEDRPPYEIEPSDWELTCVNYDKQSLIWYHFDQVLADEEEDEVIDKHRLVGDVIEESGFADNDVDTLYVRNDKIMCDFEISKIYEAFKPGN